MKIILISQVPYVFEKHIRPGEPFAYFQAQTFWLKALKKLGHQTEVFLYSNPVLLPKSINHWLTNTFIKLAPQLYRKYRLLKNRQPMMFLDNHLRSLQLVIRILIFRPNVLILSGGISELVGYELMLAQYLRIPVLLLHGVNPLVGGTGYELSNLKRFTLVVTNDISHAQLWKKLGAKRSVCLPYSGIDPEFHKPTTSKKTIEVVFAGTLFKDRMSFLEDLLAYKIPMKVYGYIPDGLMMSRSLKQVYRGEVWGQKLLKIYSRAKIVLNPLPDHMPHGANLRLFEIPACRALQIASYTDPDWFKENKEIVVYNNTQDLVKKIKYYLKNYARNQEIVEAAYQKVVTNYTYVKRFEELLGQIIV